VGDLDGDHKDDILIAPFEDTFKLIWNRTKGGDFLRVKLMGNGTTSNRDALGAKLRLRLSDGSDLDRWLLPTSVPGCWNDKTIEFGLWDASADELIVTWPDGSVTRVANPPSNEEITVKEPSTSNEAH
jgi:hypothetical protein